jgi:1-acyl-sn-glycerol-3-phosphate acyltransferase
MPKSKTESRSAADALPPRSPSLYRWFDWYVRRYQLRKHFHAIRLNKEGRAPAVPTELPLIIVANHGSWWDPLVGWPLQDFFPGRTSYAPIDAAMLKKYRIFAKLGFYGVEQNSPRGAVRFLRTSRAILRQPSTMIWITAQGEFVDVRQRPVILRGGVGHLVRRLPRAAIIPLAIECVFWTERTPEGLLHLGPMMIAEGPRQRPDEWTRQIALALEQAQDALAAAAMSRDPSRFETLIAGRAGIGGVYDGWRRFVAALRGEKFDPAHDGTHAQK